MKARTTRQAILKVRASNDVTINGATWAANIRECESRIKKSSEKPRTIISY